MSDRDFPSDLETCPRLDECLKIKIILDKDMLPEQYVESVNAVCAKCRERIAL